MSDRATGRDGWGVWLWVLLSAVVLGFAARVVVWQVSFGTNDVFFWGRIGKAVTDRGLLWAYANDPDCNQPPAQPLWASVAYRAARATGTKFPTWFKAPMLLADAVSTALVWVIVRRRAGNAAGLASAAVFACSPAAILVSAHHGNTDPVYVALSLLSVWLLADRNRPFAAALALGAAMNVKLIPALLVLPLLACCRSRREAMRWLAGLALMAGPSVVMLALSPDDYARKVIGYGSSPEHWGVGFALIELSNVPAWQRPADTALLWYNDYGKYLIAGCVVALSAAQVAGRRWDAYEVSAIALLLFLVLASGFAVQYTVAVAAVLPVVLSRPVAAGCAAIVGAYVMAFYAVRWDGGWPIVTIVRPEFELAPGRWFGWAAWLSLAVTTGALLRRSRAAIAPATRD